MRPTLIVVSCVVLLGILGLGSAQIIGCKMDLLPNISFSKDIGALTTKKDPTVAELIGSANANATDYIGFAGTTVPEFGFAYLDCNSQKCKLQKLYVSILVTRNFGCLLPDSHSEQGDIPQ